MAQWMRVVDAVGGLVELSSKFRRRPDEDTSVADAARQPNSLETRLAGVLVAALKEAFDRDSARMELERSQVEADRERADQALRAELQRQADERQRAEQALRAELQRHADERALAHLRLVAITAVAAWALTAALAVWMPGMRASLPRVLLGIGWGALFGALGCTFAGWQIILKRSADSGAERKPPVTAATAPWLLLSALAFVGASLLFAF